MIISDRHRFAFVHIPKCAGISVKGSLGAIDDYEGGFRRIGDHAIMGSVHYAHLTLRDLERYFPLEFAKVRDYASVALVRDPMKRFVSAMNQRLREFGSYNQSQITPPIIEREAEAVMRYLARAPDRLDLEHVHFNRQIDYVALDGTRIVRDIFPVERMNEALAHIAAHTGLAMADERRNRTTEIRIPGLKPVLRHLRSPYAALVPKPIRERIRTGLVRAGVYGEVRPQALVRPGGRLDAFVRDYYAADIALHAALRAETHPIAARASLPATPS